MAYPILQEQEYLALTQGATLMKRSRTKIRLLLSKQNKIIKHIYKRKLLSSSTLWPHVTRFVDNARHLASKNLLVPEINSVHFYPPLNCHILIYDYVDGETLSQHAQENGTSFFPKLIKYITHLHKLGVYFKDIHLDNIIVKGETLTLIDLESIQYQKRPLTTTQRARNLVHLFNKKEDVKHYQSYGLARFLTEYFELTDLPERSRKKVKKHLQKRVTGFNNSHLSSTNVNNGLQFPYTANDFG